MEGYDISRAAFDPRKHYDGVLMQQGRVLTDDDWNENERIEHEERRRSRVEIIGAFGSQDKGFGIEFPIVDANGFIDFNICPGTIHLGGLRLDLERNELFRSQKDWLQQYADQDQTPVILAPGAERFDLVYLETWQQPVSAVEDTELIEVALGGADTTTRIRNMRRVKILKNVGTNDCSTAFQVLKQREQRGTINEEHEIIMDARLKVSCVPAGLPQQDLCSPSVIGGYLGAENQTIRIQLVDSGHLTWGFDNAAPLYRVQVTLDPNPPSGNPAQLVVVKMLTEPKDQYHWPLAGQIVEILPWGAALSNGEKVAEHTGHLSRVKSSYNPDTGELILETPLAGNFGKAWQQRKDAAHLVTPHPKACVSGPGSPVSQFFYMRVWNRGDDLTSNPAINFVPNQPVLLGTSGLQATISGSHRNAGDYWVISTRPETPDQILPWEFAKNRAPHGVRRFVGSLAIIRWFHNGTVIKGKVLHDCRPHFPPLNNITAGDVKFDNGTCGFAPIRATTVQEAIDNLCKRQKCTFLAVPGPGWEKIFQHIAVNQDACICFQVGTYLLDDTVTLEHKGNITFSGGGNGTRIIVKNAESAFLFKGCKDISIRDLSVASEASGRKKKKKDLNGTLAIYDCFNTSLENVTLTCAQGEPIREATCITVRNLDLTIQGTASIRNSYFNIGNAQVGILAVNMTKTHILANHISAVRQAIGNQGIVVAGTRIDDVHIRDNRVHGVMQGIHVGVSHRESSRGTPDMAGTVIISGNHIECALPAKYRRERHGIFVGNCNSLIITENYLRWKANAIRQNSMHGIYLYGHFGKRIIIKNNHLDNLGVQRGIAASALNAASVNTPVWIVAENVASVSLGSKFTNGGNNFA